MEVSVYENGEEVLSYQANSGEDSVGIGTATEGMPEEWSVDAAEGDGSISG
mgnify:CR=1 FL=1